MAKVITVVVEKGKGERNFSCFATEEVLNSALLGYGPSACECIQDFYEVEKEVRKIREGEGKEWPELEYAFVFDIGSFFDYYPLNISAFAKYIGMNAAQLRQYASSAKEPRQATLDKIHQGLQKFLSDMGTVPLIDRPVTSYN